MIQHPCFITAPQAALPCISFAPLSRFLIHLWSVADNAIGATHTTMKILEPSADEIRDWGNSVMQLVADYFGAVRHRTVYRHMSSREIRDPILTPRFRPKEPISTSC